MFNGVNERYLVTTSLKSKKQQEYDAINFAKKFFIPYLHRRNSPIKHLMDEYHNTNIIVMCNDGPRIVSEQSDYFFHINLAGLRIKNLQNNGRDKMIEAMQLTAGMSVCDCTLGLASDAIVSSFVGGETGNNTGIEASLPIYMMIAWTTENYIHKNKEINDAVRRINPIFGCYSEVLPTMSDNKFDIVYFDPMFTKPIMKSSGLSGLRRHACHKQLLLNDIKEAMRVAKYRVVIKYRCKKDLPIMAYDEIIGSNNSNVNFAVLYK